MSKLTNENQSKNPYLAEIEKAALKAYNSKGTDDYPLNFANYMNCVKNRYVDYLYNGYSEDHYNKKLSEENINDMYCLAIGKSFLQGLINNFNPEKGSFDIYFVRAIDIEFYHLEKRKDYEQKHPTFGLTGISKERNKRFASRLFKFMGNINSTVTTTDLEEFCKENNIPYEKGLNIFTEHKNSTITAVPRVYSDTVAERAKFDNLSFQKFNIGMYNTENNNISELLEKLDDIYAKEFSENHKKIFPPIFTANHITDSVDYIAKTSNPKLTREQVLDSKWRFLHLEDERKDYADFLCISCEIYDIVISTHKLVSNKEIAANLNWSPAYISREYKKISTIIENSLKTTDD